MTMKLVHCSLNYTSMSDLLYISEHPNLLVKATQEQMAHKK
jgi:hypothetical protein